MAGGFSSESKDEYTDAPIPRLASTRLKSLEIRITGNLPRLRFNEVDLRTYKGWRQKARCCQGMAIFKDFLGPFLKASPELKRVRLNFSSAWARLLTLFGENGYGELLDELAACALLEELERLGLQLVMARRLRSALRFVVDPPDEWGKSKLQVEYYQRQQRTLSAGAPLESVERLLQSCRRLRCLAG